MPNGFVVDEKFPDVIEYLVNEGWVACPHHTYPNCLLRYTNYVKIQWQYVKPHQTINHLQHSILLSRKHELLHHLETRPSIHSFLPRSTTDIDFWFKMFVYTQALLVLKNREIYAQRLPIARLIGDEMRRLNDPTNAKLHGLQFMNQDFLGRHSQAINDLLNPDHSQEKIENSDPHVDDELLLYLEACDPQFHFNSTRNLWIAKPSGLSQGRGIELISSQAQFDAFHKAHDKAIVVQQYIERPFLIFDRKFDIRQWVLITDTEPLTIYWYDKCYLRFASKPYSLAHDDSLDDKLMHLCNNSIQKASDIPNHPEIPGHMWNLERFQLHLSELGQGNAWEYQICPAMQHACVEAILAVHSKLKRVGVETILAVYF
ncbi:hypothetical protein AeMF1_021775 [Aphanomyces euteiches]|nr:hypothetical protein AeMF1_021775 [Aphanomyces euteiches]KAH9192479.1 hypothetical protein AeNC1_005545 [Aphanomyces euteiches]